MANNVSIAKLKKGDTVILCAFTGMKIGVKEVTAADKNTVTIARGTDNLVFDRKTAKQIEPEPKAPRFANFIIEDDGSYVKPQRKKKEKPAKAATKKAKPEPEDDNEEDEEDETPAPKKVKKPAAKKAPAKKQPEPEEDEDDDEEEWDDDDFEEVD